MAAPSAEGARVGLILLGASSFPSYPSDRGLDQDSFGRSARAFKEAMTAPGRTVLGGVEVLDLFDSAETPAGLVATIQDFLAERPHLSDVVLYYCGHGAFLSDGRRSYALLLKGTHPKREAFTALPFEMTRHQLEEQLANRRMVLILDACFAGHAVSAFQSSVGDAIEEQVFAAFPRSGTTLLLASSKDRPGLAPGGAEHTMFTGGLVHVLRHGIPGGRETMTLDDLLAATADQIQVRWGGEGVQPEIQSPRKAHGDLARQPYFHNAAYVAPAEPGPTEAEEQMLRIAVGGLESELKTIRMGALEALGELASKTSSGAMRQRVVAILNEKAAGDDSKTVREKADELLLRHTVADVPPTASGPVPEVRSADPPAPSPPAAPVKSAPVLKSAPMAPISAPRVAPRRAIGTSGRWVMAVVAALLVLGLLLSYQLGNWRQQADAALTQKAAPSAALVVGGKPVTIATTAWEPPQTDPQFDYTYASGVRTNGDYVFAFDYSAFLDTGQKNILWLAVAPDDSSEATDVHVTAVTLKDSPTGAGRELPGKQTKIATSNGRIAYEFSMDRAELINTILKASWIEFSFTTVGSESPGALLIEIDDVARASFTRLLTAEPG